MSLFGGLFSLILTIAVVIFAISNRHNIDVFYLPGEYLTALPLYAVALGLMAVGFFIGALSVWFNYGHVRRDRRNKARTVKKLEKEIEALNKPAAQDNMPASDFFPAIPDIQKLNKK